MALGDQTFCGKLTLVGVAEVREYFNNNARFREIDISSPKIPEQLSALLGMDFDPKYWTTIGASAGVDPPCSR